MGVAGPGGISFWISQERVQIEIHRDAVRLRRRLEFDCGNGKGAGRIIDEVLSKLIRNERLLLEADRVELNRLIEVSHHFIKIISLKIGIERPDKILGFLLSD